MEACWGGGRRVEHASYIRINFSLSMQEIGMYVYAEADNSALEQVYVI